MIIIYFIINLAVTVVSNFLVIYADNKYWKKDLDMPDHLLFRIFIAPQLLLMEPVAKSYGYMLGLILSFKRDRSVDLKDNFHRNIVFIKGIMLMVLALPIFVYGVFSETYWTIRREK